MDRIRVPIEAYILGLFPQTASGSRRSSTSQSRGQQLKALANGLAVPSFWRRTEITEAFDEANRLWIREAEIEFSPINISARTEVVPADSSGMWIHFLNNIRPRPRGIGVGFVFDLPSDEGGWGGGGIALVAGQKARSGLPGFAGRLLAHELGHALMNDRDHSNDPSNLMYRRQNPRVVNAGLLNEEQIKTARRRALNI